MWHWSLDVNLSKWSGRVEWFLLIQIRKNKYRSLISFYLNILNIVVISGFLPVRTKNIISHKIHRSINQFLQWNPKENDFSKGEWVNVSVTWSIEIHTKIEFLCFWRCIGEMYIETSWKNSSNTTHTCSNHTVQKKSPITIWIPIVNHSRIWSISSHENFQW